MEDNCSNNEVDSVENDASQMKRLIIKSFISQICNGVPFYKCNLPLVAWEGTSFLEKLSHFFSCSPMLMVRVKEAPDFMSRFFAVIALYLSGWHAFPLDIKKPIQPIQGEVFRCSFVHNNFKVYYLAEQVQPSVTAFCVWSPQLKMFLEATLSIRTEYSINSVDTILDGTLMGTDTEHNETYIMSYPSISVGGIIWGKLHASVIGDVKIHCPEKGYTAILSFEKGKLLSGEIHDPNSVKPLFQLKGYWNSIVYLENCNSKASSTLFNVKDASPTSRIVAPLNEQQSYESQQIWKNVVLCMELGNSDLFFQAKSNVEQQYQNIPVKFFEWNDSKMIWTMKNLGHAMSPSNPEEKTSPYDSIFYNHL